MKALLNGKEVAALGAVADLLRSNGINPETVLVKKDGRLVPSDYSVRNGDRFETIAVISGG